MKNYLKSIFISLFTAFAVFGFVKGLIDIINTGFSYLTFGMLLISITIISLFAKLFIFPTARTSKNLIGFSFVILLGFFISFFTLVDNEPLNISKLSINGMLVLGWILYLKWYSIFENREDNAILKVGEKLPSFEVKGQNNKTISSDSFLKNSTIFMFYRGNWCPLCMAQIKEVVAEYKELEKRSVNMVLISPQPSENSSSLADKFNVPFHFLTDVDGKVAKKLNIFQIGGTPAGFQALGYDTDTVMPTVIITDKNGKIIFVDLTDNYRIRPEPKTFLKIIDKSN